MRLAPIIALLAAAAAASSALASPVDDLVASGYMIVRNTKIVGDFDGCDYGLQVPLADGGTFTCSGFGYMHASNPKAVLLKSRDGRQYKLVVGNAVFDGAPS